MCQSRGIRIKLITILVIRISIIKFWKNLEKKIKYFDKKAKNIRNAQKIFID